MTTSKIRGGKSRSRKEERKHNALTGLKLNLRTCAEDKKTRITKEIANLEAKLGVTGQKTL